ncbi:hypothetical protein RQM47_15610 [Rubrivirga sp. S365]|uniref:hypothetical protein n=1 Tax=Rubrivirga sp. S365 TaxID=3076080 RepID=UPI0028C8D4A9|nr:hypothetical protein [Rubrivirga sp. S365]MDT7858074.1 hypothetical protein [Rubrivirga sp. S365]
MTLIVAKKLPGNRYAFVADFRISYGRGGVLQSDEALKFFDAGGRPGAKVGFFAAGAVAFWQVAAPLLKKAAYRVSVPEARKNGGPLHRALNQAAGSVGSEARGVVFAVQKDRNQTRVMVVRVFQPPNPVAPGMVAELERFPQDGFCAIGSGASVPNLRDSVDTRIDALGDDASTYQVAVAMRDAIRDTFEAAGPDAYRRYGVSPDMSIGLIEGGHFRLAGETGFHLSSSGEVSHYELSGELDSGVELKDKITGETHTLIPIDKLPSSPADKPLDVQRKADDKSREE